MRLVFAALAAALSLSTTAAATEPPSAQAAFVERRGLLEADAQCRIFTPQVRAALLVSALQARGALLRGGWSLAQLDELENATVAAARARACGDPRTNSAAATARAAYNTTFRSNSMEFPGWARTWSARRVAASDGWRLRQDISEPISASFGVRQRNGVEQFVLVLPASSEGAAPRTASLQLRNPSRSDASSLDLAGRMARGLEAGLPGPGAAMTLSATRRIEHPNLFATQAVFVFSDEAFRLLCALDPRETVEIDLSGGRMRQRLLVEVGDVAAARGFLATRAD